MWISFTTDYGLHDGFVAACHGVIARLAPDARVIDVTHDVPPQNIRHGAAVLAQTVPYLPEGVHLAVVDPGVGTARRGIVVVAEQGLLVGPDNGVLPPAADALGGVHAAYELAEPAYRLPVVSATFHGRDVFAPAAAHLALGVEPSRFGPAMGDLVRLPGPRVVTADGVLEAEVLTVDRFGNIQLAARESDLPGGSGLLVHCGRNVVRAARGRTFEDVPPGELVVYPDSAGYLAVAVNGGSAASALGLSAAAEVTLTIGLQ
jgi:S-adenosylmethionine hydrolase